MPTVLSSHCTALSKINFLGRLARAATRGLTTHARFLQRTENLGLRALLVLIVLASSAGIAQAQQIEVAGGGSILESPTPNTASLAYVPPSESGGVYAGFSLKYLTENLRGLNFEVAFRAKEGLYNGSQFFRPI